MQTQFQLKVSDVVYNDAVKKAVFNSCLTVFSKVVGLENKIPNISMLGNKLQHDNDKQNLEKKIENIDKRLPNITGLVTNAMINTKIIEIENRILSTTGLIKKISL